MKHRFLLRKPQVISDERYWKVQIKVVTEEYKYEQDRCFKVAVTPGTWNWGGRNGRQQWILPVCLLLVPQSQGTRWMFSCHICNYTLEIISDKIQATLLTIALAFPWGWSAASWQAGCRRLGDRSARLNRLHLPLHSLPTKEKCSRAWLNPCPLGGLCVSPVSAQKIWQWLLRRWGYIPEALIEVSEIMGERSMKRGVRSPMWMCGAVSFLLTGFLTERWLQEPGVFSYLA